MRTTDMSNRAVVQRDPAWTEVFSGESLTLRCEVEDEGGSEWSYDWMKSGVIKSTATREYTLSNVSVSDSGDYRCRATSGTYQITMWSQKTRLQVLSESNVLDQKVYVFLDRTWVLHCHSLSSTAGFLCRASQGSPEVYTEYSPPQFVWSAGSSAVTDSSSLSLHYNTVKVCIFRRWLQSVSDCESKQLTTLYL
uniref:Ig-like domain-containing protein n=1 Tax=Neogobius melanostomus TaxID=47308 RepID=A0A8C6UXY0_9GOBI